MTENGWGKVRKINGKAAMPSLVTDGEGDLKKIFGKRMAL
jgi:hypothetical protein